MQVHARADIDQLRRNQAVYTLGGPVPHRRRVFVAPTGADRKSI